MSSAMSPTILSNMAIMGLLPDTWNCGLRMRRECRERFPRRRLQRKPLVSDPDMHHGTFVTHVPWCMLGSLTRDDGENVPGIPGACATRNFTFLARGPLLHFWHENWPAIDAEWRHIISNCIKRIQEISYFFHSVGWKVKCHREMTNTLASTRLLAKNTFILPGWLSNSSYRFCI